MSSGAGGAGRSAAGAGWIRAGCAPILRRLAAPGLPTASEDPRRPDVIALLERHLAFTHEHTPIEDIHALDVEALARPEITFFSGRLDGVLVVVGALKELDPLHGELKSMHAAAEARRRGLGRAMV